MSARPTPVPDVHHLHLGRSRHVSRPDLLPFRAPLSVKPSRLHPGCTRLRPEVAPRRRKVESKVQSVHL